MSIYRINMDYYYQNMYAVLSLFYYMTCRLWHWKRYIRPNLTLILIQNEKTTRWEILCRHFGTTVFILLQGGSSMAPPPPQLQPYNFNKRAFLWYFRKRKKISTESIWPLHTNVKFCFPCSIWDSESGWQWGTPGFPFPSKHKAADI